MISALLNKRETLWVYLVTFLFIALNGYLISSEFYYLNAIPWLLLVVLIGFYSLDRILLLIVFFTPVSVELSRIVQGLEANLHLPTEPLMLGALALIFVKYIQGNGFDRKILYHPVSIAIYLNLFWIFITAISSSMVLVSMKFLLARIWFLVIFYFLAAEFFKEYRNMKRYIWFYTIPMLAVIFIILFKLSAFGLFNKDAAHFVVRPFFVDHTSYGAVIAFLIPVLAGFALFDKEYKGIQKLMVFAVFGIYLIAIILSYTRAAWVSLLGAIVLFVIIYFRIRFSFLVVVGIILTLFVYSYRTDIIIKLEQNRQASSKELSEHVKSISNVATDASNLERLNRWSCAWRMFKERPIFGWGPGTYMFQYAPFQISRERTTISTNFADLGNAHSEYIGPLAESGFLGMITFTAIVILTLITGLRVYYRVKERRFKILSLSVLLGLTTYYLHGLLNNFLDTDKASALFWGFTAMLVTMDIYYKGNVTGYSKESTGDEIDTQD